MVPEVAYSMGFNTRLLTKNDGNIAHIGTSVIPKEKLY